MAMRFLFHLFLAGFHQYQHQMLFQDNIARFPIYILYGVRWRTYGGRRWTMVFFITKYFISARFINDDCMTVR
jgi:hypothetical protein